MQGVTIEAVQGTQRNIFFNTGIIYHVKQTVSTKFEYELLLSKKGLDSFFKKLNKSLKNH